ncbi:vWFA domain-containing protein [Achlya hypogyna]|uniref:VWFA domain-containing protein n=1 Tax=Achlya hypogyna TaxID=1202772 RepID=A0A1V9YRI5_ACHHY|nr:vWFA domain-containing protein [Achlya hypogyna]
MEPHAEPLAIADSPTKSRNEVDLFLVCDTTGSMGTYVASLASTICQVFALTELLFRGRLKLHVVSYKDYCDGTNVLTAVCQRTHSNDDIRGFAAKLRPSGGGDYPEAVKTALNHVIATVDGIRASAPTSQALVFIYADAPPHHQTTDSRNHNNEVSAIAANPAYRAGDDWFQIQKVLREEHIPVFTLHSSMYTTEATLASAVFYALLGPVVVLPNRTPTTITKATMGLLLQLMDQPFDFADQFALTNVLVQTTGVRLDTSYVLESEASFSSKDPFRSELVPFAVAPFDTMREPLDQLPVLFKADPAFQDLVYATFAEVFTPENVLAVTYNPVLAKLWRLMCGRRLDDRLAALSTKLSTCIPALSGDDQKQLKEWLEASHDNSSFIQETVTALTPGPAFVLAVATAGIDKNDLRSLARAPSPGVLAGVQSLLTHLQLHQSTDLRNDDGVPMFLPATLTDAQLFSFLPHLLYPGTTFSLKGAAVMALLCCLSGHALLKPRAEAYLAAIAGSWLPLDKVVEFPEIVSLEFIKLMYRGRAYLTPNEAAVYTQLYRVHRIRLAATLSVDVDLGYIPEKSQVWPDVKALCTFCGHATSLSFMAAPDTCTLCVAMGAEIAMAYKAAVEVSDGFSSHMVECRECHGLYAVIRTDLLNVAPKCYYCRTRSEARPPLFECNSCLNSYVDPAGLYHKHDKCAVCTTTPEKARTTKSLPLEKLVEGNPTLAVAFGWTSDADAKAFVAMAFNRQLNYFKMFTQQHDLLFSAAPGAAGAESSVATTIVVQGKRVHDAAGVRDALQQTILSGSLQDVCYLCFDEFSLPALESACGRCTTKTCASCLSRWYGDVQPGKLVVASNLACPFCRREPKAGVLRKFNRAACGVVCKRTEWRPDMYYGWCLGCYEVKEMAERACVRDAPRDVTAFHCAECREAHEARARVEGDSSSQTAVGRTQECPGCQVMTEKVSGCNHITCTCGQHWCYVCAEGFETADDVYDHLYEVHRGVYD